MGEVPAARQHHHALFGMRLQVFGGTLGHAFVPQQLHLEKMLESLPVVTRVTVEDL